MSRELDLRGEPELREVAAVALAPGVAALAGVTVTASIIAAAHDRRIGSPHNLSELMGALLLRGYPPTPLVAATFCGSLPGRRAPPSWLASSAAARARPRLGWPGWPSRARGAGVVGAATAVPLGDLTFCAMRRRWRP